MANRFKRNITNNVGTTPSAVYVTPLATRATVIGINVANILNQTVKSSIKLLDGDTGAEGFIVKEVKIGKNTALAAMGGDQKLVLEPGDSLIIINDLDNSTDVIVSVLEITQQ